MRALWAVWLGALLVSSSMAAPPKVGELLFRDDFTTGLAQWHVEAEQPGRIAARDGELDIDVPAGATLWFRHELQGPVAIVYEVTAIDRGGPNDRVSDVNCFWMARNRDGDRPPYEPARSGAFADYNTLRTYYVGLGGNGNTTTRFRRYIGDPILRPLLPEHDLAARDALLVANRKEQIMLVAHGSDIEYWRGDRRVFLYRDAAPYTRGWFALRTTQSHLRIENLRIHKLQ